MPETLYLSIIIPAYNEQERLPKSLPKIDAYLARQAFAAEVIVVDDGSADNTAGVVEHWAETHPNVRVIRNHHAGKGAAVKTGMLAGGGEILFLADADLSMPIEQLDRFFPLLEQGCDVVIGSREAPDSRRIGEPSHRHFMGRAFNAITRWFAVPGIADTQCGFKAFRHDIARELFSRQHMDGMSFDVEVLYIAQRSHYRIAEVGIDWYFDPDSRVRAIKHTVQMFRDVMQIRGNERRGLYHLPAPTSPVRRKSEV